MNPEAPQQPVPENDLKSNKELLDFKRAFLWPHYKPNLALAVLGISIVGATILTLSEQYVERRREAAKKLPSSDLTVPNINPPLPRMPTNSPGNKPTK